MFVIELFSVIMTTFIFLATTFLEFWKRRQAVHQYDWDITADDDQDRVRPDYAVKLKHQRKNPVTQVGQTHSLRYNNLVYYEMNLNALF